VLYWISFDGILLRCLKKYEIPIALEKTHEGICVGHFRGRFLVKNLIFMGYYWKIWKNIAFPMI
jgi:hypothetical protein